MSTKVTKKAARPVAWRRLACRVRPALLLLAVVVSACWSRPPFAVVTVEDPTAAATGFASLYVGTTVESIKLVAIDKRTFPLAITITARSAGDEQVLVDVRGAADVRLATGQTTVRFSARGTPTGRVVLKKVCARASECDDGLYCNGAEDCQQGVCVVGTPPCGSSVVCVAATCQELGDGVGVCNINVDHNLCGSGEYCNPVRGCVAGVGCVDPAECQDEFQCNGAELCANFMCAGGAPPATDDNDPCTQDGCNETLGVFHLPKPDFEGVACPLPEGGVGICLTAAGGCVPSTCGDSYVDESASPPELCDDGPANSDAWSLGRHCNATCSGWAAYCGDGTIAADVETCDDGDARDTGNGCNAACQRNAVCGDGQVQTLYETCDDQNSDPCDGCTNECQPGCICSAPGVCLGANWCDQGACVACDVPSHCGPACLACVGEYPACAGAALGCVCDPSPLPRGSCAPGTFCDAGGCTACDTIAHCGQDCVVCPDEAPVCAGPELGCITADCTSAPDFTACQAPSPVRSYNICMAGVCVEPGCLSASCNPTGPSFAHADIDALWQFPDSGQVGCYDGAAVAACPSGIGSTACATTAFCGQDGQYGWDTTHSWDQRYQRIEQTAGEPVVIDLQTGLVWQGCAAGARGVSCQLGGAYDKSWPDALAYCDNLTWNGYRDWRLPDFFESASIMDASRSVPSLNLAVFPNSPGAEFWTSTVDNGNSNYAWAFLPDAIVYYSRAVSAQYHLWCVRSSPMLLGRSPAARFNRTNAAEPVVTDTKTNLVWQGCTAGTSGPACGSGSAGSYSWQAALAYCEGLVWDNADTWRLPNLPELLSLTDKRASSPTTNATAFPASIAGGYWSSTTYPVPNSLHYAFVADLAVGASAGAAKLETRSVRCVR